MGIKGIFFGFQGRLPRLRWLGYSLALGAATAVVFSAAFSIGYAMERGGSEGGGMAVAGLIAVAWGIVLVWSSLALNAKRLHDLGWSAWHLLWINGLNVVAQATTNSAPAVAVTCGLAGLVVAGVFVFMKGTAGPNAFGEDPVPGSVGTVSLAKA